MTADAEIWTSQP